MDRPKESEIKIENYLPTDQGPFVIHLEKEGLKHYEAGKLIIKAIGEKHMIDTTTIKDGKVKVRVTNYRSANMILASQELKSMGLKAYIPINHIISVGTIDGIKIEEDLEEIRKEIKCEAQPVKIERIMWYNHETKTEIPTEKIKISFRAYNLPSSLSIFGGLFLVKIFVPKLLFCKKCLSYGHFKKICKSQIERCPKCAKEIHPDTTCETNCKFCNTNDHPTNAKECQEKIRQFKIKKYMVQNKCSYKYAKDNYTNRVSQIFAVPEYSYAEIAKLRTTVQEYSRKLEDINNVFNVLYKYAFPQQPDTDKEESLDAIKAALTDYAEKQESPMEGHSSN
ncbi:hypothetical protein DMENIID0001_129700 [Sergentomyia squamirostris]